MQIWTRGGARSSPPDAAAESCIGFHRSELQRQYELLRGVWRWYLGPLVPGLFVLYVSVAVRAAARGPMPLLGVAFAAAITALVFVAIGKLNQKTATRLRAQIEELDRAAQ